MIYQRLTIIISFWIMSLASERQNEHCFNFNPDTRHEVDDMNFSPGNSANVYPTLKLNQTVRVKDIVYYAVRPGDVYISFWKHINETRYRVVSKELMNAAAIGRQHHEVDGYLKVPAGSCFGVHQTVNEEDGGVIAYEHSAFTQTRSEGVDVYPVHLQNVQDNGWVVGETEFSFSSLYHSSKSVAVHMTVCACEDGYYGDDCLPCSRNCKITELCNKDSGFCEFGCNPGFNYTESLICDAECSYGFFGPDCSLDCNCENDTDCDKITGVCPFELCDQEGQGQTPSVIVEEDEKCSCNELAAGLGGALAGVFVGALVTVLIFLGIRYLNGRRNEVHKEDPQNAFELDGAKEASRDQCVGIGTVAPFDNNAYETCTTGEQMQQVYESMTTEN